LNARQSLIDLEDEVTSSTFAKWSVHIYSKRQGVARDRELRDVALLICREHVIDRTDALG
jgi:hypothetical protein